MPEQERGDTSGPAASSEAVFIMDPEAVVWGLARMLVDGQSTLAAMVAPPTRQNTSPQRRRSKRVSSVTGSSASKPLVHRNTADPGRQLQTRARGL